MTVDYLERYVAEAPLAHALFRATECKALARVPIEPPVLDLGCGDGLFAQVFFQGAAIDVGLDADAGEAKRAKSIGSYRDAVMATGAALPFADCSFRTILSNSVLEHVADLPAILDECHRVLEPTGRVVITAPLIRSSEYFFFSSILRRLGASMTAKRYANWKHQVWRHHNLFDEEGWVSAVKRAGFQVDDLQLFNSRNTVRLADLLFVFSPLSVVSKKLFGRMVLRPAFLSGTLARGLRRTYERDESAEEPGATICLVAIKPAGAGS